jgi:hypothetical protein
MQRTPKTDANRALLPAGKSFTLKWLHFPCMHVHDLNKCVSSGKNRETFFLLRLKALPVSV